VLLDEDTAESGAADTALAVLAGGATVATVAEAPHSAKELPLGQQPLSTQ